MNTFEKFSIQMSNWFNWAALAGLTVMLGLITVDIVGAKIFKQPIPGAMDLTSLLGLVVIAFSVAQTLLLSGVLFCTRMICMFSETPR